MLVRIIKKRGYNLTVGLGVEIDAEPIVALFAGWFGDEWVVELCEELPAAAEVAFLDFGAGLGVPLPHQEREPFFSDGMAQHRKPGEVVPFVFLGDVVFFERVCGQVGEFHKIFAAIGIVIHRRFCGKYTDFSPQKELFLSISKKKIRFAVSNH